MGKSESNHNSVENETPAQSLRTPLTASAKCEPDSEFEKKSKSKTFAKKIFSHHIHLPKVPNVRKSFKYGAREPADELKHEKNEWGLSYEEELESIDRFRKELSEVTEVKVKEEHLSDERKLLRFLKARNFDMEKAKEMYVKHLKWRKEFDVDNILFKTFPERDKIIEQMPQGYHMCDKDGRPVYIQYVGSINVHKMLSFTDEETVMKCFIQEYEKLIHFKLPACSEAQGTLIEQSLNILDVNGVSLSMLTKESQRLLKKITSITQDNYPEMMGKMIIINAPYIFKVFFSIVKPMLSSRTQSKIEVHGSRYLEKLLHYVDIDSLPTDLGGNSKFTIIDDIGPWSENVPALTSKRELEEYDAGHALKWSQANVLRRSDYSVYFSDEDSGHLDGISKRSRAASCTPLQEENGSACPQFDHDQMQDGYESANCAVPLIAGQKPSLLHWIEMLENDFQQVITLRPGIGSLDNLKFPASTSDTNSLLYRLELLEARVIYCKDLYPTGAEDRLKKKSFNDLPTQPSWLNISRSSSSASLVTRMHIVESHIENMMLSYQKSDGEAQLIDSGNQTPDSSARSSRFWSFSCCT